MKKILSSFLLVSMAAGCATPAMNQPVALPRAGTSMAAAPQERIPVVATGVTAKPDKALSPLKAPITPALNKPALPVSPALAAPAKALATWDDFDPMKALSAL